MSLNLEQPDASSLSLRLQAQKQLVARLVAEGKDAKAANAELYDLSKALDQLLGGTNEANTLR